MVYITTPAIPSCFASFFNNPYSSFEKSSNLRKAQEPIQDVVKVLPTLSLVFEKLLVP